MSYISSMIDDYVGRKAVRFHMPGHKGKLGYERDLTEVDDLDDLACPNGAILNANKRIAKIYGMDYATMATCGSTGCIHAMLLSSKGKVLIGRDAHKSAVNAAYIFNIPCEFIENVSSEGYIKAIENTGAKTLYITYPNYYGSGIDVNSVVNAARKKGMMLIADCAHGAHFISSMGMPHLPKADMLCVSVHKTLGALTGGAAVMCKQEYKEQLKDNLFRVHSTSPSYLIMESIDNTYAFIWENPQLMARWKEKCLELKNSLGSKVNLVDTIDPTRIVFGADGYTGYELQKLYRDKGIIAEMADMENIVFLTSLYDIESIDLIGKIDLEKRKPLKMDFSVPSGGKYMDISRVKHKPVKTIYYKEAKGMVSYNAIGAYPPGVAAVMPGEVITEEIIDYIERIFSYGGKLFSIENEMIQVIDI